MKVNFEIPEPQTGKRDHFFGDRSVVLSRKQLELVLDNPVISDLFVTDIGFYPNARNHYRKRKKGIGQNILIYCIGGCGTVHVKEQLHQVIPDSYFIVPAGEPHSYWASEETPWSIYWVHFAGLRAKYFSSFYSRVIPISHTPNARIDDRINMFNELLTTLEMGFSKENIEYTNLCLNSLLASFFYIDTFRSVKGIHSSDPVDLSILYMQQNLTKCLKIEDIAAYVKLSESHLSKLFRNKTGSSPIDYFINLKMQEAIRLLTNKLLRIKEVAFKLGYSDQYYFTRIFTKQIGTSPASFLKISRRY